jgi:hypothetical protein
MLWLLQATGNRLSAAEPGTHSDVDAFAVLLDGK